MQGINHISFGGNITADAESRVTQSGSLVTNFTVASNRNYRVNGVKREEVTFLRATLWGNRGLALIKAGALKKGSPVYVEGRLRISQYEDRDGNPRTSVEVVVQDLTLLGSRRPQQTQAEVPDGDAEVFEAPAGEAPAGEAPAGEAPAGEAPANPAEEDAPF